MRLTGPPFRATVAAIAVISFLVLLLRSRPLRGTDGVEPVLFVAGLHQPRGLAAGQDGTLYVAEAGWDDAGQPVTLGRLSHVTGRNQATVLVDGLPAATGMEPLLAQSGPAAVTLPPMTTTSAAAPDAIVLLGATDEAPLGTVAHLIGADGAWELTLPAPIALSQEAPRAGQPATVWGAQVGRDGAIYATFPLANRLVRIPLGPERTAVPGEVTTVTGFIGPGGSNPLPAGVALAPDGTLFVAHFGAQPFRPGSGRIVQVAPDGRWQPRFEGLSFPVALAFGPDGQLYVLEFAGGYDSGSGRFAPRSGRLLAVGPSAGRRRVVVRDVHYPTALAISAAGDAYFTENGAFSGPGQGRILFVPAPTLRQ